jgi:ATP-dependent Clp endopeptidase proteolytic subunit ClpP
MKRQLDYDDTENFDGSKKHRSSDIDNGCNKAVDPEVKCVGNHIYFNAHVDSNSISKLVVEIQRKNNEYKSIIANIKPEKSDLYTVKIEPNPIKLHISSFGGSILAAMSAIDAIQKSKIPVHTIVDGFAASAGTLMSIAGKKKYMTKNSYMLIHQLSSGVWGQMNKIEDNFTNCKAFMERIRSLYKEHTKLTDEVLDTQLKHDNWWDADTCMKHGLIDEIY